MYFSVHAQAFDEFMKFKIPKFQNLNFSRTKRAFEVKQKNFFLVSEVHTCRPKNENNKNISDTNLSFTVTILEKASNWTSRMTVQTHKLISNI